MPRTSRKKKQTEVARGCRLWDEFAKFNYWNRRLHDIGETEFKRLGAKKIRKDLRTELSSLITDDIETYVQLFGSLLNNEGNIEDVTGSEARALVKCFREVCFPNDSKTIGAYPNLFMKEEGGEELGLYGSCTNPNGNENGKRMDITIYKDYCHTYPMLFKTLLHEFCHFYLGRYILWGDAKHTIRFQLIVKYCCIAMNWMGLT